MHLTRARSRRASRLALLVLLVGLVSSLFGAAAAGARQQTESPDSAQPAQAGARVFLPMIAGPAAAPAGSPVIESFRLSAAQGPMAGAVELRWQVSGATRLRIEPDVGDVLGATSVTVNPIATTTYTLTASNDRGTVTASATYTVNALPEPNPLSVSARPDTGRAVAARVGAEGGIIEATGADGTRYTLSIPPEALLYTEVITLTPVAAIDQMPFATPRTHAVSVAPEGLLFVEPATLTIVPPASASGSGQMVGFAYQGAGAEFHLRTLQEPVAAKLAQAGASVALSVVTAESFGAAPVDDVELLAPLVRRAPSEAANRAEHVNNATPKNNLTPNQRRILNFLLLQNEFEIIVERRLAAASNNPEGPAPFDLESAVRTYIKWREDVRAAGVEDQFRAEISRANLSLGEALRKAGALASERCNQGRPAQGFALQRYVSYAKRFGLTNTSAALEERLAKCWNFRLTFQSYMDQQEDEVRMEYEVKATLPLGYQSGGQMVGSAPLTWEHFSITQPDGCTVSIGPHVDGIFRADGEGFGLRLWPVSRTSPNVNFQLTYQVGQPMAKWAFICDRMTIPYTSPFWWVAYYETHADERLDESDIYTAQALDVHPNAFTGWVYDIPVPGGLGDEHTEIRLEHDPIR